MKLILKEYLASLKERGELDAILPDLLSQLGLNVFSRPARGTRQDGVDVGAFGSLNSGPEKVYLFSIKSGDLTRITWNTDSPQSLRPSLDEIRDAYILNRLPSEYQGKDIVICLCFGGDVQEPVRPALEGYIKQNTTQSVSYEQWNGDKLAALIEDSFLREDLLPSEARSRFRKSLAMLDQPDISYKHFSILMRSLSKTDGLTEAQHLLAIRQIALCLWILFSWARKSGDLEAAYVTAELAMLHAWEIARGYPGKSKTAEAIRSAFTSTHSAYDQISTDYLSSYILPHVDKFHGLSSAVRAANSVDINLKLFDVLSRLAVRGLWHVWQAYTLPVDQAALKQEQFDSADEYAFAIRRMIANNPALLSPIKDDQTIDITIALFLLSQNAGNQLDMEVWLGEIFNRCAFAYTSNGKYPCILRTYGELLDHPTRGDDDYRQEVTAGSILYPAIGFWAAMRSFDALYADIGKFEKQCMKHCNFQFWYPDQDSEERFYTNSDTHGAVVSNVSVNQPKADFLAQIFAEVEGSPHFKDLSAIKYFLWPIVVMACRHHRVPLPIDFFAKPASPPTAPVSPPSP
jgi:hypothetical protein